MPKVGSKHFPYTKKGKRAAKTYKEKMMKGKGRKNSKRKSK